MTAGEQPSADSIDGVTLAQHASVAAALAEGHPLAEALAWAGVAAGAWPAAAVAWRRRLADDRTALAAHLGALAEAEDRLYRHVPPIDEDAAAWVAFITCVEHAPDVPALLDQVALSPNDVARLTRAWTQRIAEDPKLRRRVAELRGREVAVLPAVRPGPRTPLVSTATAAPPRAPALDAPAEMPAEMPAAPVPVAVPSYLAAPPATPPPAAGAPRAARPVKTAVLQAVVDTPAVPFSEAPPEQALAAAIAHAEAVQGPARPAAAPGGTMDVGAILAGGALPFDPPSPAPAAPPPPGAGAGATMDIGDILAQGAAAAVPFAAPTAPAQAYASAVAHAAATPGHAAPGAASGATGAGATMDVGALLAQGAPPPPPAPLTLVQYASLCVELHREPQKVAETLARYRLSAPAWAATDAEWRDRLAADTALYAAFWRAYEAYRAFLAGQR